MEDVQMVNSRITSMEDILGLLVSMTDLDTLRNSDIQQRLDELSDDQLVQSMQVDPLSVLDPALHSLGYMYFLTAQCIKAKEETVSQLYNMLLNFVKVADMEQLKLTNGQMSRIVIALDHLALLQKDAMLPLEPLYTMIQRLSATETDECVLTVYHSALARQCILTKMYHYALPVLRKDIVNVDPKVYGTSIEHYLEYHYYGAILWIGNKEFEKACDFFMLVLAAPTHKDISAIQLEAYKRYLLTSLITYGEVLPLPKYVSNAIEKLSKKHHGPYLSLVTAFEQEDMDKLTSALQKHQQTFIAHGLLGLAKQLIQASYRKRIKTLTSIYMKIKLDDLNKHISNNSPSFSLTKDQVEHLLVDMIGKSDIDARISIIMVDGLPVKMVHFDQSPSKGYSMEQAIATVARTNEQLTTMDKLEGLNFDFQSKYMVLSTNAGQGALSSNYDEDMEVPVDEDIKDFS